MVAERRQGGGQQPVLRTCARPSCSNTVKKRYAKYCSISCSATDPGRRQQLRDAAVRRSRSGPAGHPAPRPIVATETGIGDTRREDVPGGFQRIGPTVRS